MRRAEIVEAARQSIDQGSKSFGAASRLFDPATRERAWLLYCWCRHCDDVADGQVGGMGQAARGAVFELRAKTQQVLDGGGAEELPFQALAQLLAECPIPHRFIEDHLAGFEMDEGGWRPTTEEDLALYCYHVAGAVGCMMAIVMGVPANDEATLERAADLGIAFQLSNIARDIRDDWTRGRCYLPRRWLHEFGIEKERLFDAKNLPALTTMAARLIDDVAIYEASARKGVERLPFRSRLAVLAALRIYGAIGRRVSALGEAAWDRRVTIGKSRKLTFLVPTLAEAIAVGYRA